jgi:hypothetical protein
VQVESVYAGQPWTTDAGLQQQMQQLDGFLNYFVDSPYVNALKQYGVSSGTFLGHDVVGQNPSAGQTIDDSQIRALLDAEITANHVAAPTANRLYVLFTAPGVVVTQNGENSVTDFAGYHDVFTDSGGATVYYTVVPYPSGNISALPLTAVQQATIVLSHEVSEAITDPDTHSGWFDPRRGEIGDITAGQIGSMGGYAVQALWSQVDGKAVIPTSTSATTVAVAGTPAPVSPAPVRNMLATLRGADAQATSASFMAFAHAEDSLTASPLTRSQGGPSALLASQSPGSPAAFASSLPRAVPSFAADVQAIPNGSPRATSLRAAQDARYESGGDDHLLQILEDELPAAGSALPREEAFPSAAMPGVEQEVLPALPPDAALWREASTAYFAQQGAAAASMGRALPRLVASDGSARSPEAAAAALALLLGAYGSRPAEDRPARRRQHARP